MSIFGHSGILMTTWARPMRRLPLFQKRHPHLIFRSVPVSQTPLHHDVHRFFEPREAVSWADVLITDEERKTMSKKMIVSILVAAATLASGITFAAPGGEDVRSQVLTTRAQPEDGKTRYWSHHRLGLVKVDAAGRMLTPRSTADDAARSAAPSGSPSSRGR